MAVKASERVKRYQNPNGPTISTVERKVIEQDGLYFKDIDGTGTVSAVNDWRLTPAERAEAYVKVLTTSEKIGQIFTSDWRMGPKYPSPRLAANGHKPVADESGLLDEAPVNVSDSIFGSQSLPSTSDMVKKSFNRHVILRESPTPEDLADYLNQLQYLTETCDHFVPMQVMSNSRNENGEVVFGMNDATGVFATYPGTLGIAAAVKGTARIDIIDKFADTIRREWNACGLKKGYMYMADCVPDPRWQRTFGTFGEDPALIEEIFDHLIPGIQGGSNGVTPEGVSMTVKHFPGGGARENGFDPHYAAGQWNIYATPGSLQKYHIPAFRAAIRHTRTPDGAAAVANSGVFTAGDLTIDYGKHRVYISGRDAGLTQNEYKLVALLGLHAGKVLTYDYLIKELWGPSARSDNQILRVNMANIRRKIEKTPAQPKYIFTEVGVGYRMAENTDN